MHMVIAWVDKGLGQIEKVSNIPIDLSIQIFFQK